MSKFTQSVKNYLHENAITQQELAESIGVTKQYLSAYLNHDFDSINMELKCKEFMANGKKIK